MDLDLTKFLKNFPSLRHQGIDDLNPIQIRFCPASYMKRKWTQYGTVCI
jgi:hypothetical protein